MYRLSSFISFTHKAMDYVLPQKHSVHELVFYAKGEGSTVIDGQTFNYRENTVAIIPPNVVHDELAKKETVVYCCLFELEQDLLNEGGILSLDEETAKKIRIEELMLNIYEELTSKQYNYEEQINCYFTVLLNNILRQYFKLKHVGNNNFLEYVRNYIKENYAYIQNFEAISDAVGYSYDRLRRLFAEQYGISLSQYLLGLRMAKAKELLENSQLLISDIASRCGFSSDIVFINTFKNKMGISPKRYRMLMSKKTTIDHLNIDDIMENDN